MVKVTCLGAARSVTGSNFLVETSKGAKVVVDCGLFQGGKQMESRNWEEWGFDPKEIQNLILTHAHIDHSGRIPKLVKDGFTGRIVTSPPTAELCELMLLDSAHVQEMDAEWQTRKRRRRARRGIEPLYTTEDAQASLRYLFPIERDRVFDLEPGFKLQLRNAGHILGSSIAELWVEDEGQETKIVFSGDLGKTDQLIVQKPYEAADADYLFVESTYGNRLHRDFEQSKAELLEAILYAVSHNDTVIIPAFALERTQEVLYLLGEFSRAGQLPDIPIYLDSPLAIKATEVFRRNKQYYDQEARAIVEQGFDPFDMPNLKFTRTTQESMEINRLQEPAIVISANGMCTAGRIKHHLKHNLWRPGASLIIIGFQAQGTTGRKIVEGAKSVTIFADRDDLLKWVGRFAAKSKPRVFVIHGESVSSEALALAIQQQFRLRVHIPDWREVVRLGPREAPPKRAREPVTVGLRHDMLALTADLEAELARLKEQLTATDKEISEDDLEHLRDARDRLRDTVLR
ncbi:MAG: MBL fold metallo-hydrolase [Deltaproteobacteria bacterium]